MGEDPLNSDGRYVRFMEGPEGAGSENKIATISKDCGWTRRSIVLVDGLHQGLRHRPAASTVRGFQRPRSPESLVGSLGSLRLKVEGERIALVDRLLHGVERSGCRFVWGQKFSSLHRDAPHDVVYRTEAIWIGDDGMRRLGARPRVYLGCVCHLTKF